MSAARKFYPERFAPGCLAFWDPARGNVLSGSNVVTVADQATGGQDTLTGASTFEPQWVANNAGFPAWSFASQRFTVPDSADLSLTTQASWAFWVAPTTPGTNRTIISKWVAGAYRWSVNLDSSNYMTLEIDNSSVGVYLYGTSTAWTHNVFVFDGTQATNATRLTYYLNGVLTGLGFGGTIPATLTDDANAITVGDQGGLTTPFSGNMGSLGIWGRPLSAAEIAILGAYQAR